MFNLTFWVIAITSAALIIYDILVVTGTIKDKYGDDRKTLSRVMKYLGVHFPFVPMAAGVLMGHFFWPLASDVVSNFFHQHIIIWLSVLGGLWLTWSLVMLLTETKLTRKLFNFCAKYPILVPGVSGVLIGHFAWGI